MKFLLVFDFDHTIVDENSDTWIVKCAPEQKLPLELQSSHEKGKWTEYMARVFKYLGDQGVRQDEMKQVMTAIPLTDGMTELLQYVEQNKDLFDCIIISDSNTLFIDWILEGANAKGAFEEVFSNPAAFNDLGYIIVQNFHSHSCPDCPQNLCKKKVLEEYVDLQVKRDVRYTRVIYVGDGSNDLCPVKFLKQDDVAMPRFGYGLQKTLSHMLTKEEILDSAVEVWITGIDILNHLKLLLKEPTTHDTAPVGT